MKAGFSAGLVAAALLGSSLATSQEVVGPEPRGPITLTPSFQGETTLDGASATLAELEAAFSSGGLSASRTGPGEAVDGKEVLNMIMRPPRAVKGQAIQPKSLRQQIQRETLANSTLTPPPLQSFEGTSELDNAALIGGRIVPPDTEGDIGRQHYVQMNNVIFEVYDKRNGNTVLGPLPNNVFFFGQGSFCDVTNDGDPIVLYDHQQRRWIFSQFALFEPTAEGFFGVQCFAVSKTADVTGEYYLYEYRVTAPGEYDPTSIAGFNDYPKLTVWPNGIYLTTNDFILPAGSPFFSFGGVGVTAFDKRGMYRGAPAVAVKFQIAAADTTADQPFAFSLQPSHWEGRKPPKRGNAAPNIVFQVFDDETWGPGLPPDGPDGYRHWAFDPDFKKPERSTFVDLGLIPSDNFSSIICFTPSFGECAPQPDTDQQLDTLSQFTMYRAQYRAFGGGNGSKNGNRGRYDSVVISHTVDPTGAGDGAVRWAELRDTGPGGSWVVHQAGTYDPPDDVFRWMPTIAQDRDGNIALGFSASSKSLFPSVRYTARMRGDPSGTMGTEASCFEGTGSQLPNPTVGAGERWGDYASLSVDPVDECTFWYTNEYYENTADFDFRTRICSFRIPGCGPGGSRGKATAEY